MTNNNPVIDKMPMDALGSVEIAPQVIETIAAEAARQVKGVRAIRSIKGRFQDLFSRESGIIMHQNNAGQLVLEIFVEIEHNINVPTAAMALQQHISEQIYFMTDVQLDLINIHVDNLYTTY